MTNNNQKTGQTVISRSKPEFFLSIDQGRVISKWKTTNDERRTTNVNSRISIDHRVFYYLFILLSFGLCPSFFRPGSGKRGPIFSYPDRSGKTEPSFGRGRTSLLPVGESGRTGMDPAAFFFLPGKPERTNRRTGIFIPLGPNPKNPRGKTLPVYSFLLLL